MEVEFGHLFELLFGEALTRSGLGIDQNYILVVICQNNSEIFKNSQNAF